MQSKIIRQLTAFMLVLCLSVSQLNVTLANSDASTGSEYALSEAEDAETEAVDNATEDADTESGTLDKDAGTEEADAAENAVSYSAVTENGIEVVATVVRGGIFIWRKTGSYRNWYKR